MRFFAATFVPRPLARVLVLASALPTALCAQFHIDGDFSELSLEELVQVEISSLGRKNSTVFNTPAPAYIVTNDEIHRSGATGLPEVLRLVPGVQVSRIDASAYSITIRGFNDFTSNKLLVLRDGRSIYNGLLSGANWPLQDMILADVSRVEVQRGPAGTLWGANAVNGVINLVGKNAHSTVGSLFSVATGDQFNTVIEARHGWTITPALAARVYAKHQDQGDYGTTYGAGSDGWNSSLVGTRLDWDRASGGGLTLIAEHRELRVDGTTALATLLPPYSEWPRESQRLRSTDVSAKWRQPVFDDGDLTVLASVERGSTNQLSFGEHHTTADLDAQLTLHPRPNHEIIAGLTYRSTFDNLRDTPWYDYQRTAATTTFLGAFLQDEFTVVPDRFKVTAGTKVERNSYTGWEIQPSVRALWHPTAAQTVWGAVSRAARTPSRTERDVSWYAAIFPPTPDNPLPGKLIAQGDPNFSSESATAYELGHRFQRGRTFSVDTSLFFSRYEDLRGLSPQIVPPDFTSFPLHYTYIATATNSLHGHTYGGELALRWQPVKAFRFDASVASVRTSLESSIPGLAPAESSTAGLEGNTPHEEYKLHVAWDFAPQWSLDLFGRRTGRLPEPRLPAYTGLDARLAWRPRADLEFELIGRDLLDPSHAEISGFFLGAEVREISRSVYLRVTFKL